MEVTLKFDLPEEKADLEQAMNGQKAFIVIFKIDNVLRSMVKHGHKFEGADEAIEGIREELFHHMEEEGISFDMIE